MVGPGVGTGSISAIVGFCSCLSLFMDIGRISESVEFAPLLQLIQGRVRSARTLVDCRKHFPRRPNSGRGGIDGPPPSASNNRSHLLNNETTICSDETTYSPVCILLFTGRARIPTFAGVRVVWGTTCFVGGASRQPYVLENAPAALLANLFPPCCISWRPKLPPAIAPWGFPRRLCADFRWLRWF